MSDLDPEAAAKLEAMGITTVKNKNTSSPSIEPSMSASIGYTAPINNNEPPAEYVELPSHGFMYKSVTDDPDVLEKGRILIRPMTVEEEKILNTPRLVKTGQALDLIFRNCIKSRIDPTELLSSDRVYLMLWLRSISYGNIYKFWIQSQDPSATQKRIQWEVDLSKQPIREFTDPTIQEPFTIVLPYSKKTVVYRLPRGKDEVEMMKLQNQTKALDAIDQSGVQRLISVIVAIVNADGTQIDRKMYNREISGWVTRDASELRNALNDNDCGIEPIMIQDPNTGYEFEVQIPITEDFFRVTK